MPENTATVEQRIRAIEDRLAIYNLLATHPLTADTGMRHVVDEFYAPSVAVDRGVGDESVHDRDAMADVLSRDAHQVAVDAGLAHFGNLPYVRVDGDAAVAVSYIALVTPDDAGEQQELSNHGMSKGYRIHRVAVNQWTMERTGGQWRVTARVVRMVGDGAAEVLRSFVREHVEAPSGDEV